MSGRCLLSSFWLPGVVAAVLSGPSLARAQDAAVSDAPTGATSGAAPESEPKTSDAAGVDEATLQYVTSRYFAAVRIRPDALLKSPWVRMMPIELLQSRVMTGSVIDLTQVDEVLLLLGLGASFDPLFAVVCRFNQPYRRETLMEHLEPLAAEPRDGMPPVYRWRGADGTHAVLPDDRTLIVAPEKELRDMVFSKQAMCPLARHLRSLDSASAVSFLCAMAPIRGLQFLAMSALESCPEGVEEFVAVAELLSAAELSLRLDPEAELSLVLQVENQDSLAELEQRLDRALSAAVQLLEAEMTDSSEEDERPPILSQLNHYYKKVASQLAGAVERRREDDRLVFRVKAEVLFAAGVGAFTGYCLGGTLEDDVADDLGGDPSSASMERSMSNLDRIGDALTEYQNLHHKLPQSSRDPDGKPLLSWRVHLLPFLDNQELYERFHLDEPWDSEHNRPLLSQMPDVYRSAEVGQADTTQYLLATGPAAVFSSDKSVSLDELDVDDSDMILVVEANSARGVAWTRPGDFTFDPQDIFAGLGGFRTGGFLALLADGTVDFIQFFNDAEDMRELFRPKAKEPDGE